MNKICVYAICKNELKFVDKWLDSMSEADYIVVMDTGSTDGTFEKLKSDPRVTKVIQKEIKPWRFDVARNESMKLCPDDANILICTDFDELLSKGWADIVRANWKEDTTRGFYNYAWSHNSLGERRDTFKYDKMHTRDYEWKYPVHEVLVPKEENFQQIEINFQKEIWLDHWQDKTKPRKFYFELLELACKENPNDSHIRMLLAREYLIKQESQKSLEEFLEVLKMPDIDRPSRRLVLLNSLIQVAFIYEAEKNFDEAMWYCQEFIKEDKTYREPYFLMAEMYNIMKMHTLAEACCKAGFEYGVQKYDWVERGNTWLGWGYDLLSVAQIQLGKLDEAEENIKIAIKHEPNDIRIIKNYTALLEMKIAKLKTSIKTNA